MHCYAKKIKSCNIVANWNILRILLERLVSSACAFHEAVNIQTKTVRKRLDVYQCTQVGLLGRGTLWFNHLKLTGSWWWCSAYIF